MAALRAMERQRVSFDATFFSSIFMMERSQRSGTKAATPISVPWRMTVSILSPLASPCTSITAGPVSACFDVPRDAHDGKFAVEADDLALEVVAARVDHGEVLPRLESQHARVLGVLAGEAQREGRIGLVGEHLVVEEELVK